MPGIKYLVRDNQLCLQILTIAHVYAHNDFFTNTFLFQDTCPELALSNFKVRAKRVRNYIKDPSIRLERPIDELPSAPRHPQTHARAAERSGTG